MTVLERPLRTVLFVDDSKECRATLEVIVQNMKGWAIRSVSSAEHAVQTLEQDGSGISVLITDFHLPRMNGLQLLGWIRRDPRYARLPVIVVSGDAHPETLNTALSLGANAVFAKPYSPAAIRQKLEEVLRAN